jgi:hypothetical protein
MFFFNAIWVPKYAEFDADYESVKKAANNLLTKTFQKALFREKPLIYAVVGLIQ